VNTVKAKTKRSKLHPRRKKIAPLNNKMVALLIRQQKRLKRKTFRKRLLLV